MNIVIIGAGQLGSRHLQGLALLKQNLNIYLIDPSEQALETCKERFNEVDSFRNKVLYFRAEITNLPQDIDMAIISTTSKYRFNSLELLLSKYKVKYLILEKFLFSNIEQFRDAKIILNASGTKAYVNCGRRMFNGYKNLRKLTVGNKFDLTVKGDNWNLGSNAIHFVDLFYYLNESSDVTFDSKKSNLTLIASKHKGYDEFIGTVDAVDIKGNSLKLICNTEKEINVQVELLVNGDSYRIDESQGVMTFNQNEESFPILYQSQMTNIVFSQLIETDHCELVSFEESTQMHLKLLNLFNTFSGNREGIVT